VLFKWFSIAGHAHTIFTPLDLDSKEMLNSVFLGDQMQILSVRCRPVYLLRSIFKKQCGAPSYNARERRPSVNPINDNGSLASFKRVSFTRKRQ